MNFKRGNPGCPCDCAEHLCVQNCYFPCGTDEDAFGYLLCAVCSLDIQMPQPDITGIDPLLLPPEECEDEARCHACYALDILHPFDYQISQRDFFGLPPWKIIAPSCNDFSMYKFDIFGRRDNFDGFVGLLGSSFYYTKGVESILVFYDSCWSQYNHACPYDVDTTTLCPSSNILLSHHFVKNGEIITDELDLAVLKLSGNEWDGECGRLELEIRYTIIEIEAGFLTTPVDPEEECPGLKFTNYTHLFELEYCTCEEMYEPFVFVSTTTEDSCFGGVEDDVCNAASAVISLQRYNEVCGRCTCFNCDGYYAHELQLTISGPVINGTFILFDANAAWDDLVFSNGPCTFRMNKPNIDQFDCLQDLVVEILCNDCDGFTAFLKAATPPSIYSVRTLPFFCGESVVFDQQISIVYDPCDLANHTITLSFVLPPL